MAEPLVQRQEYPNIVVAGPVPGDVKGIDMDWSLNSWTSIFYIIGGYHGDCWRRFFTWVNLVFALWSAGLYGIAVFHNPLIGLLIATSVTAQGSHLLKNYSIGTWNLSHSTTFRTVIAIFSSVVPSMGRWPLKGMKCQRDPKGAKGATSPHRN